MAKMLNRSAWIVLVSIGAGTLHSVVAPVRIDRDMSKAPTVIEVPGPVAPSDGSMAEEDTAGEAETGVGQDTGPLVLEADVSLETAIRAYDAGVTFLDARTAPEFEAGHIAGAFLMSPGMFEQGIPAAVEFLSPGDPIIVYCVGGACTDSDAVVIALEGLGFESLHVFKAGYPAWVEAGMPIEDGPDPFAEIDDGF